MPQTPSFGSPVAFSFDSNNRSPNNIAPIMNNNTNLTANSQQLLEHASNRIETLYVMLSNPVAPPQAIGIPEENQIKPENLAPLSGAHIVATFQHLIDQVGIQNNYIEKLKTQISQSRKANACGLGGGADDQEQIEELQQQIITIQKAYRGKNKEFNELVIKCNNLELEIENSSVKNSLSPTPSHSQPPVDVTVSPEYISLLEKFNALQVDHSNNLQPKTQIEPDDERNSELQTQLESVSSQLKAAQSELIDIKSQVSILTEEKNQALSIQAQLESDQVQIKAELEQALATRLKPNEEIVSPITESGNSITNEELDQALAKIEALGNKTASLQQQNDDLTAQITLSNDHLEVIKAEKDQFEEKYTSLNTNYELLRDQLTISQNELNVIKSQFEAYKAEYTTSNDSLDTMRLEIREEMATQAKIRQEKIITKAKERVSELNQQIEELTQQHESDVAQITEQARSRVEKLKTGALSLKNDYDVLNDEHLHCLHKHQELENEILTMRSKIDELQSSESLKNVNDSSIEDITHQHQLEMKSLQSECDQKISQIEAQTDAKLEKVIQDAQLNVDNILADNKVLIEQLNHDHYAQIEKLRDEMNTKQLQTEEASENRQEELSDIVDENQSLQSTIQMKNNHIDTLTEQIQAATTTLDEARIQIQNLENELKSSNTMIFTLQQQLTPVKPDQPLEASASTPLESHIDDDTLPESEILFETEQESSRDAVHATDDCDDSNDNGNNSDNNEEEALVKENQHFEEFSPSNSQELEEPDSTITIDVEIVEEDAIEPSSEHTSDLSVDPSLSSNGQNEPLNLSQTEENDEITDEPVAVQEDFTPENKPLPIQATTNSSPFDLFGNGDDDHDDMLLGGVSDSPVPISSPSSPGIPKTTVPDFMNQSSLFGDDDDDDSGLFGTTTSTSNTGKLSSTLSSSLFDDDLF
jgi:chromosome segregation ATPase